MTQATMEPGTLRPNAPDVMDVEPLGAADHACLQEIKDVLLRHGRLNRFGVTLLHEHFAMSDNEVLVEDCDPVSRTLTIRPEKISSDVLGSSIETSWELGDGAVLSVCRVRCRYNQGTGEHIKDHDMS